ncbi:MAG: hypothetical protein R3E40_10325 [Rhodocyclaceae bacterium]|nr:hypothetical protein [Rhodocyclaceae bacterium]MCP5297531.1 hypothetical protein [Zoogloeaceae bacterium]
MVPHAHLRSLPIEGAHVSLGAAEAILGKLDAASYVIVHEVTAEAWGYQGRTQAACASRPRSAQGRATD